LALSALFSSTEVQLIESMIVLKVLEKWLLLEKILQSIAFSEEDWTDRQRLLPIILGGCLGLLKHKTIGVFAIVSSARFSQFTVNQANCNKPCDSLYRKSYPVTGTCHTFLFWDEFCSQQSEQW